MNKFTWLFVFILFPMSILCAQDYAQLYKYKEANAQLLPPTKNENRVVFMGNSITEEWLKWMPEFFSNKPYINRGISGQTTDQMLIRFRTDVLQLQPKLVVLLAGTNDIAANNGPTTNEMILNNIMSMAELAKSNNIRVILCSVLPVLDYPWKPGLQPTVRILDLNEKIKSFAQKNNIVYIDYYSAMVDEKGGLKAAYTYDGVHPNAKGYAVMAPLALKEIDLVFKK